MRGILADHNIEGQFEHTVHQLQSDAWRELWEELAFETLFFRDVGLEQADPDDVIWRICQHEELVLVTANRNNEGPVSLEATIRNENTSNSLPVFTVAAVERILNDSTYTAAVVESMMEYLWRIDGLRGTGRLFLPREAAT